MTILFNDRSHYNPVTPGDGPLIAKATEGATFTDTKYADNKRITLAAGHPFAAYHFPLASSVASVDAQVAHALSVIGTGTPTMMDIERDINGHTISRDDALRQIDAMQAKGMLVTLAYIPEWVWSGIWGKASLTGFAERGLGLVSSHYVGAYSEGGVGWEPYGGYDEVSIWQYTDGDTSRGFAYGLHGIDTNAFRGTEAELRALFQGGITMALTDVDAKTLLYTDDLIKPSAAVIAASSDTSNTGWTLHGAMEWLINRTYAQGVELDAIKATVAALPTTAAPAAPLDADTLKAIAKAVLDEQHERDAQ